MRKLLIVLLTCFLLASVSQALELTNLRDEAWQSIIELNAKAWEGDVNAQYYLGEINYWQTSLVKQNISNGLEFYYMAAEQNHVEACIRLADIYIKGDSCGTPKNETEAFKWYLKAAELGNGKAQIKTGEMYFNGQGTGSPWENGYCESFNSCMRDEFLNGELFGSFYETEILTKRWVKYYNEIRPHSSLGGKPPAPQSLVLGM